MLDINGLNIAIKRNRLSIPILSGMNLHLEKNDTYVLMGESGCGKSMLALAILGLLPSNAIIEGDIRFKNIDLKNNRQIFKLRGKEISICWSNPDKHFNPLRKIGQQVMETYLLHNKVTKKEAADKTKILFEKLNLPHVEKVFNSYPHQLSGGMNQRAMIASSIINNPELLILDEPTRGLDDENVDIFCELLKKIDVPCKIIITHDPLLLSVFDGKAGVMKNGKIIYESEIKAIPDNIDDSYLKYFLNKVK